ncbi:hypothetical protein Pmar_PMAR008151 [Perkinsus marinus ATCC 50983]|uniref:Uncharacterized protein n=1 Tax=Perkinsus marinus (strain ATCC 50983 / TXsc) TaxID=423536 RepID=C5K4C5_PERM5|nr:hypothetical protein Pmar_PMAR008151 [Perkinsus marinus ATCC 50983]EER20668.1 hypothetical protein Pmar_PMAR008151 [Perkinsus marinus ATCC 50983]|eukprot:XP_002788872.1 hypothetical protein Pmar_PMAR008151 [Perkinsus marinus ATCC 50983]
MIHITPLSTLVCCLAAAVSGDDKPGMIGILRKPYDGNYLVRYGEPSKLFMRVTVDSEKETIAILFKCGPDLHPYDHTFPLASDQNSNNLILKDYIDNTKDYKDMLNSFKRSCPQFGSRPAASPDLGEFKVAESDPENPRSLETELGGVSVKLRMPE